MNQLRLALLAATAVGIFVVSSFGLAYLKPAPASPPISSWAYTVNWTCNIAPFPPEAAVDVGLSPGEYQVRISVENPSSTMNVTLKAEFVESIQQAPQDVIPKWITKSKTWTLKPQAGLWVDCSTLSTLFQWQPNDPFSRPTGFATLTAATPSLVVVATYTARTFNATGVPTGISVYVQQITPVPAA